MRYTTLLDISEDVQLYKNKNARLVYLHMVLKAGYHDSDRDKLKMSIREISWRTGISLSATRHALKILTAHGFITYKDGVWDVRKFLLEQPITPRAKKAAQEKERAAAIEREIVNEANQRERELQRKERDRLRSQGKNGWIVWYEQKMALAAMGDAEAADVVKRKAAEYKMQLEEMKNSK